jgi:hypothetical protein
VKFHDESISIILSGEFDLIHETTAQKLERQILRTACKRKAVDMMSERPSKIINSEHFKMDEENLEKKNLKYVRQSMYRERRKLHPTQPKNQAEFHSILDDIGVVTNKDDDFVLCNDSESGIILFGCEANLKFLCTVSEEIFADETYKCCPKYFKQLDTIHGFKNGHYIPLVFCLLPSKSEACYRKMFSLLDDSCKRFNLDLCIKTIHLDFEDRMHVTVTNLFPDVVI